MPKKAGSTDNVTYRKPKRTFENSGTVNPEASYYVPLKNVVNTNKQDIKTMVDKGRYFSIFAPRQSGKTTFLEEFCSELHKYPIYIAIMLCFQDYRNLDITGIYSEIEPGLYDQLKPYEKTGQFLLTAWLYQFVGKGNGELSHELRSWQGILDILLTYKDKKYIIESKVNRYDDIIRILEEGITQVTQKYLATEAAGEGYLVIFDTKTHVGAECEPKEHREDGKKVIIFIIGIGKNP